MIEMPPDQHLINRRSPSRGLQATDERYVVRLCGPDPEGPGSAATRTGQRYYSVSDGGAHIKNDPARAFDKTAGHRSDCRA